MKSSEPLQKSVERKTNYELHFCKRSCPEVGYFRKNGVYPHINYAVVLERMPPKRDEFDTRDYSDTMLPEGIETVHPCFAISWRNKRMIKQSDYVVTYITHSWGGASQFAELAEKQKKTVINVTVKADGVQTPMR